MTRIRSAAAGLLAIGLLLATGCSPPGAEPTGTGTGTGPTTTNNLNAQQAKGWSEFVKCARKNGVPNPSAPKIESDGDVDIDPEAIVPKSTSKSTRNAVWRACQSTLMALNANPADEDEKPQTAAQLAALKKFAACMRTHGHPNWPDPQPVTGIFQLGESLSAVGQEQLATSTKPCKSLADKAAAHVNIRSAGAR